MHSAVRQSERWLYVCVSDGLVDLSVSLFLLLSCTDTHVWCISFGLSPPPPSLLSEVVHYGAVLFFILFYLLLTEGFAFAAVLHSVIDHIHYQGFFIPIILWPLYLEIYCIIRFQAITSRSAMYLQYQTIVCLCLCF